MENPANACVQVAKGRVGESGATALLCHTVAGPTSKIVVLRHTGTSLCQNTGVVATLAVNGVPVATGSLTAAENSIQTEARPGDHVAAAVHTVPLFNNIVCVRLGNLDFRLDECELVGKNDAKYAVPATREWFAWNNTMPPGPSSFHVLGAVQVANPGVEATLAPRNPQGINPRILLLDLTLIQKPGFWPQLVVWTTARYDQASANYDSAQIFFGNNAVATVDANIF